MWVSSSVFLSTLSLRRATMKKVFDRGCRRDFYPRSPCGERLSFGVKPPLRLIISIHALLAESDACDRTRQFHRRHFYPRSPCGERRWCLIIPDPRYAISIHALLAESDVPGCVRYGHALISIHALLAESDGWISAAALPTQISIHALLAESDRPTAQQAVLPPKFLSTLSLRRATAAP